MPVDAFVDFAAGALPTALSVLGVIVSIKAPNSKYHASFRWGLFLCGLLTSAVIFWQQSRSRNAHASEVAALNTQLTSVQGELNNLQTETSSLRSETATLRSEQQSEAGRRQQAEKDLLLVVQGSAKATREGVAADIRKSPIQVVGGQSSRTPAERELRKNARDALSDLLKKNGDIRVQCKFAAPENLQTSCIAVGNAWIADTGNYLTQHLESSYRARFDTATGVSFTWGAATREANDEMNTLNLKANALKEFLAELQD